MPITTAAAAGTGAARPAWTPFNPETASSPLLIDAAAWHSINIYVHNGTRLPENVAQTDINGAYALIRAHTKTWRDTTFPKTIAVADDIVDYAGKAGRYFDELAGASRILESKADGSAEYESSRRLVSGILGRLISDAVAHAATALEVKGLVLEFRSQTLDDQTSVKALLKKYDDQYGETSEQSTKLLAEIDAIRKSIDALNSDYTEAVVAAATSPSYAFIIPVGSIAAAVVIGVFTDRAIKIRENIAKARDQLKLLGDEQKKRVELMALLKLAVDSVKGIDKFMEPAIQGLAKCANAWNAIAADTAALKKAVENMTGSFDMLFLDIPLVKESWRRVGVKADAYRAHAFSTVITE